MGHDGRGTKDHASQSRKQEQKESMLGECVNFPMATVTNCHKLGRLKGKKLSRAQVKCSGSPRFSVLGFTRAKSRCQPGWALIRKFREESFPRPFG